MKWTLGFSIFLAFGSPAFAAVGDAAACQQRASNQFAVCYQACRAGSTFCGYRCHRNSVNYKASCPGAASEAERRVMDLTNAQRRAAGLRLISWDLRLGASAQGHAANMAAQDRAEHNLDGKAPADRMGAELYSPASWMSENIYWGQGAGHDSPDAAIQWWMGSAGHRANILDPRLKNIGVGVRPGANGKWYFCQNFGTP
jgi:uncharacterized protein YkwD